MKSIFISMMKEIDMSFWIFKCNPEKYNITSRLADPNNHFTWTVTRFRDQIGPGDIIFIWETGPNRGIRAVIQAESAPQEMPELPSEQSYWAEPDNRTQCRVFATITHRHVNLPQSQLRSTPGLENLSVFHGFQQGTNFPVTSEEGHILMKLVSDQQVGCDNFHS